MALLVEIGAVLLGLYALISDLTGHLPLDRATSLLAVAAFALALTRRRAGD